VDRPGLPLERAFEGETLGRWVRAQRAGWSDFDDGPLTC
jgi:hypothetical protein